MPVRTSYSRHEWCNTRATRAGASVWAHRLHHLFAHNPDTGMRQVGGAEDPPTTPVMPRAYVERSSSVVRTSAGRSQCRGERHLNAPPAAQRLTARDCRLWCGCTNQDFNAFSSRLSSDHHQPSGRRQACKLKMQDRVQATHLSDGSLPELLLSKTICSTSSWAPMARDPTSHNFDFRASVSTCRMLHLRMTRSPRCFQTAEYY